MPAFNAGTISDMHKGKLMLVKGDGKMRTCKYCGCEIDNGFCCSSCWDEFEEDSGDDDDEDYGFDEEDDDGFEDEYLDML